MALGVCAQQSSNSEAEVAALLGCEADGASCKKAICAQLLERLGAAPALSLIHI